MTLETQYREIKARERRRNPLAILCAMRWTLAAYVEAYIREAVRGRW